MKRFTMMGACLAAAFAVPAAGQNRHVFGASTGIPWMLTVNGMQSFSSVDTGWIQNDGYHVTPINNYFAGESGIFQTNNWAVFDLSSLNTVIYSAVLSINTARVAGNDVMYQLYDVDASLTALDAYRNPGDAAGIALFNDLGTGTSYGSRTYNVSDNDQVRTITLNAAALSAIQNARGQFALGGTVVSQVSAIPEPATWAMMMSGFGVIGAALRRRRRKPITFAAA